jgi:putative FmdB family regulatory protein
MPLYDYKCLHGHVTNKMLKIAEYKSEVTCDSCGCIATRIISAPAVLGDYAPYECPVTGKMIEGRKQHEDNLRRHGCRLLETGERDQFIRSKATEEKVFESKIEHTVGELVEKMPVRKREQLASELANGADTTVVRLQGK